MTLNNPQWILFAIAGLALLAPLAWRAWSNPNRQIERSWPALAFRMLGISILLFSLLDPQRISERPIKGANVLALLADNSEGLRIKDRGEILDRGEQLRQQLVGRDSTWIAALEEEYQLRNYSFDRDLRRMGSFESLDFSGDRSNIAASLASLKGRLTNLPLAGVLLFSDGIATDQKPTSEQLAGLPPIYPIIVGNDDANTDIALGNVVLTQSAFDDSPLSLQLEVSQSGIDKADIEISIDAISSENRGSNSLLSENPDRQTQSVTLTNKNPNKTVQFNWTPNGSGIQFFKIGAAQKHPEMSEGETDRVLETEATYRNNQQLVMADRGQSQYRILYVTGRPNWEYKFLNRSLSADPQLDMVGLIRVANREPKFEFKGRSGESSNPLYRGFGREDETERYDQSVLVRMNTRDEEELQAGFPSDAETLFEYDALIIDDLEASFFTFTQQALIRDFVKQRGGGLLMLGGAHSLNDGGYDDTPLSQAMPIYLDRASTVAASDMALSWKLTREGWVEPWTRVRANELDERSRLEAMPLLKVLNALPHVKPGARALAVVEDTRGETYPALVTRSFGAGRVAAITVGDLWRWGMQGSGENEDLARFWRQTSRWLVKDTPRQVQLVSKRLSDGSIQLVATARNADFLPLELGAARLEIKSISTSNDRNNENIFQEITLEMSPVPNEPGTFSVKVPIEDAGGFLAKVSIVDSKGLAIGNAETGWVSQPLVAEYASITPNRQYLEDLAQSTGGQVFKFSQLSQIAGEIAKRPSPIMETWSDPLWHKNWVFGLAALCFLAEWMIRRRKGLA